MRCSLRVALGVASAALCVWHAAVTAQDPQATEPSRIENPTPSPAPGIRNVPEPPAPIATIEVDVVGFRNDRGQALVALFRSNAGFPKQVERASWKQAFAFSRRRLKVAIQNVPIGIVAAVVIHDEDKDSRLHTGLFGFRLEGYGTSRDAQARFGSPDFYDAAVSLKAGDSMYLRIPLRY